MISKSTENILTLILSSPGNHLIWRLTYETYWGDFEVNNVQSHWLHTDLPFSWALRPLELPPLTLVDREDIKAELSGIQSRQELITRDVTEKVTAVSQNASKLFVYSLTSLGSTTDTQIQIRARNTRRDLSILMTPSQTNTVPPITLSQQMQTETCKAEIHISEVSETLGRMPEVSWWMCNSCLSSSRLNANRLIHLFGTRDFLKSSKARRRLDAFIQVNQPPI